MTRRFGRSYKPHPVFGLTSGRENECDYALTAEYYNFCDKDMGTKRDEVLASSRLNANYFAIMFRFGGEPENANIDCLISRKIGNNPLWH